MTANSFMAAGFTPLVEDEDMSDFLTACKAEMSLYEGEGKGSEDRGQTIEDSI